MTKKSSVSSAKSKLRPLDHIVISLPDLELARARFEKLGFNVAPVARHNFGTENAIIPFANGTFLEPLAIGHRETVEESIMDRNPFTLRDAAFRFRNGDEKFEGGASMAVFATQDAESARYEFRDKGYRTGKLGVVKRPGLNIKVAFAIDERCPDFSAFAIGRPDGLAKFDEALTAHTNGALGISKLVLVEELPSDFQYYLQMVTGQRDIGSDSFSISLTLPNCEVDVLTPQGLKAFYGVEWPPQSPRPGLRIAGYDISVSSLDNVAMMLAQAGVEARQVANRIIVEDSPGQGGMFAFVEKEIV